MNTHIRACSVALLLSALAVGCQSPYHSDQGALIGGLGGAGLGAIIGSQSKHAGAGAVIGAAAGTLTGAVIGNEMDKTEARNRAMIEQQLGRRVQAGAVTLDEVIAMSQAGVNDELISTHVRVHGMTAPLTSADLIRLQQSGVSARVIQTMQTLPPPGTVVGPPPGGQPVIIEEHYHPYPRPYYPYGYYGGYHRRPGWSVGVGF